VVVIRAAFFHGRHPRRIFSWSSSAPHFFVVVIRAAFFIVISAVFFRTRRRRRLFRARHLSRFFMDISVAFSFSTALFRTRRRHRLFRGRHLSRICHVHLRRIFSCSPSPLPFLIMIVTCAVFWHGRHLHRASSRMLLQLGIS